MNIETDAIKEGLRLTLKQKFFNEWRAAKTEQLKLKKGPKAKLNEAEAEEELEELINDIYSETKRAIEKAEEEAAR